MEGQLPGPHQGRGGGGERALPGLPRRLLRPRAGDVPRRDGPLHLHPEDTAGENGRTPPRRSPQWVMLPLHRRWGPAAARGGPQGRGRNLLKGRPRDFREGSVQGERRRVRIRRLHQQDGAEAQGRIRAEPGGVVSHPNMGNLRQCRRASEFQSVQDGPSGADDQLAGGVHGKNCLSVANYPRRLVR